MRTARRASAAVAEPPAPQYRPADAWPGLPLPAPPITLSDDTDPATYGRPPRLDPGTVREILAVLLLVLGAAVATAGGFVLSPAIGLFVLGGLLLVLGVLLGASS